MEEDHLLREKYTLLLPHLNESNKRLYLASETIGLGRGGINKVAKLTSVSRVTLTAGLKELRSTAESSKPKSGIRQAGGGEKRRFFGARPGRGGQKISSPHTVGDPMRPLLWTSKTTRKLSKELNEQGFAVSYQVVNRILQAEGFSLQANRKIHEGGSHQDRDAQFQHINSTSAEFIANNEAVISVDCKKKELIGEFKNAGREWTAKGEAEKVNVYDFMD
jgi:transposase